MQLGVDDALVRVVRLVVKEVRVRVVAAAQEEFDAVVGVLQSACRASVCASTRVSDLSVEWALARGHELLDVDAGGLQALADAEKARELAEAAVLIRVAVVLQRSAFRSRLYDWRTCAPQVSQTAAPQASRRKRRAANVRAPSI